MAPVDEKIGVGTGLVSAAFGSSHGFTQVGATGTGVPVLFTTGPEGL